MTSKKEPLDASRKKICAKTLENKRLVTLFPVCALEQNPRKARFHSPGKRTGAFPPPEARSTMK